MEIIETLDIQEPAQATITQEPAQATITPEIKPKKKYIKDWKKHNKTFYEKNKLNKKTCPDCGHQYMYSVYSQHKKLKKHINGILLNTLEKKVEELKNKIF
jgi:rRNA maturation endonuclease Nob1